MPTPPQPTPPVKPGKIEWGRPGPQPEGAFGMQFDSKGNVTRTGDSSETRHQAPQSTSQPTHEGPKQILYSIPFQPDRHAKISPLTPQPKPIILDRTKPLPWTEIGQANFVVVLTHQTGETKQVGLLEMSSQTAGDPAESLKSVLALAQKLGVAIDNGKRTSPETQLSATIIGGRRAEPLHLRNTLSRYLGVTGETPRYEAPDKGSMAVAITATGEPLLLTGVPEDQLKPKEKSTGVPPLRRTARD